MVRLQMKKLLQWKPVLQQHELPPPAAAAAAQTDRAVKEPLPATGPAAAGATEALHQQL
jgi:hypothetical protein